MKTTLILNCPLLLIPFNVVAHPGHGSGIIDIAVADALSLWGLSALLTLGVSFALVRIYRRRKTASADD